jgi:predicted nucleotidyltransferase
MPDSGINVPVMGTKNPLQVSEAAAIYAAANLSDALFTGTQQRVLGALFGQPDRSFSVSELIHGTRAGSGAVQREVARLAGSGLLSVEHIGRQKRYRANPASPIHDELVGIVRKTFGLVAPLREALVPVADAITAAFVFGSVAKGNDTSRSDVDLMVVSDTLGYGEVLAALQPLDATLGRPVNPTLYTRRELKEKIAAGNSFLTRVLAQPRLWVIGGEHDLAA